jgi:hypothetical protein
LRGVPVKEQCPDCGNDYLVESTQAATKGQKLCPNPGCPTNANVEEGKTPPAWYEGRSYAKTSTAKTSAKKAGAAKAPKKAAPKTTSTRAKKAAAPAADEA